MTSRFTPASLRSLLVIMYSGISNSFVQVLTLALILVHQLWNADALLLLFVTHRCLLVIFVVLISVDLVLDSPKTLARFPVRFSGS